jgi:hypothetical protein
VALIAAAAICVVVAVLLTRSTGSSSAAHVRRLLVQRGEPEASALTDDGLTTGITNTCRSRTPNEWTDFVRLSATTNAIPVDRELIFAASYVDVGCPQERRNLELAAQSLGGSLPPAP